MNLKSIIERYGLWKVVAVVFALLALLATGVLSIDQVRTLIMPYLGG